MNSASLPEQAVESSERICSAGDQSATSNGTPTAKRSSKRAFATASFLLPRSSGTYEDLSATDTPSAIAALRTWLAQDSLASLSPSLESNSQPTTSETCGQLRGNAFAWFDRDTCGWRTYQGCLLAGTQPSYSGTWPRWGMWADGVCWELPTLAPRTSGTGGGSWRTPAASEPGISPERLEVKHGELGGMSRHYDKFTGRMAQIGLTQQVALRSWPTPNASDCRDRGNPDTPAVQRRAEKGKQISLSMSVGGKSTPQMSLNPEWVEWLMGWPIGWTDLRPLEMGRFQQWCAAHGEN